MVVVCDGGSVIGSLAHALGRVVIDARIVLPGRRRHLRLRHVMFVRRRPVRVGRWWLGVLRGYRCRMFWIGNTCLLVPTIAPTAGRRRLALLFFNNNGPGTGAFGTVVGADL